MSEGTFGVRAQEGAVELEIVLPDGEGFAILMPADAARELAEKIREAVAEAIKEQ